MSEVDLPLIIEDSDRGECPCGAEYIVGRKGRREDPVNIRLEPRKKTEKDIRRQYPIPSSSFIVYKSAKKRIQQSKTRMQAPKMTLKK